MSGTGPEAKAVGATTATFAFLAATLLPVAGEVTYWDSMMMWGVISSELCLKSLACLNAACVEIGRPCVSPQNGCLALRLPTHPCELGALFSAVLIDHFGCRVLLRGANLLKLW